jgi:hypothetical protein
MAQTVLRRRENAPKEKPWRNARAMEFPPRRIDGAWRSFGPGWEFFRRGLWLGEARFTTEQVKNKRLPLVLPAVVAMSPVTRARPQMTIDHLKNGWQRVLYTVHAAGAPEGETEITGTAGRRKRSRSGSS